LTASGSIMGNQVNLGGHNLILRSEGRSLFWFRDFLQPKKTQ